MIRFVDLNLRTKLHISFLSLIILILFLSGFSLYYFNYSQKLISSNNDLSDDFILVQSTLNKINYLDIEITNFDVAEFGDYKRNLLVSLNELDSLNKELALDPDPTYLHLIDSLNSLITHTNNYLNLGENVSSHDSNIELSVIFSYLSESRADCEYLFSDIKDKMVSNLVLMNSIFSRLKLLFLIISLFIISLSILIANLLANVLSKPISRLTNAIQSMSDDVSSYTPLPVMSKDETGVLTKSFNDLFKKLHNSKKKLKEYNLKLEEKVEQRTHDLLKKEKQLVKANARLTEVDKQKDEFISLAAHELKTPLTSIKAYSQILADSNLFVRKKAQRKKLLASIVRNTDRLYTLVLDIVDSSRISLGQLKTNITEVNIDYLLDEVSSSMLLLVKDKGLKAKFSIPKKLPNIKSDRERIIQIFSNLFTNAVKFTESGTVTLSVKKAGSFLEFSVTDTGPGIPEKNQKMIFSRFYQVDGSFTRKYGGSGLGLSVCKGLVENMGGKIWFTTVVGKGSTFSFTMPIWKK